jgi:hypothetical protein
MFVEDPNKRTPSARPASRGRSAPALWLGLAVLLIPGSPSPNAKQGSTQDTRILLIRGLAREIAVTKVPLPRGKRGVFVSADGKFDEAKANAELRLNGAAIRPGMPIEITRLRFKSNRIMFEINGGGKRGKRWYQRIEVGMGTTTRPIAPEAPVLAFGSWISLTFPERIPEISVLEVRRLLGVVLDFDRHSPTVLYSPTVPPKIKEAIKKHQVVVGMDHDAVLSAKGAPDRKVREVREGIEQEDWIYGLPPHVLFVTFDGDTVIAVRQF